MNGPRKSDGPIVPKKPSNKDGTTVPAAERVEGRGPAKGNPNQQDRDWAQNQSPLPSALERIRQAAARDKKVRFTTLWHHVYDPARLKETFLHLKRSAAPGVDGQSWSQYSEGLEGRIQDLSERLKRGAYQARPTRRVVIPKADGGQRLLGIPALEDKLVQRATTEVLSAVYEEDFLNFSYGFRPGRNPHDALDALSVGLKVKNVNWVLDADIRGFFDSISHEWLIRFVEHRIADKRVTRHLQKWLKAGALEDGQWVATEQGTVQGGSISPLLANVYLHYVLDLWTRHWRRKEARGAMIFVRYADDFIVGFEHRHEAERFLQELGGRLHKFGLALHPDKTRLVEFGRFAAERRARRGEPKPESFDFLGFTHLCSTTKRGQFMVRRKTVRKRLRRKLSELRQELMDRRHSPIAQQGKWLASVLRGHFNYYGVPHNGPSLSALRFWAVQLWYRALRRRSQRSRITWKRIEELASHYLPAPRIVHPYPSQRLSVTP